MADGIADGRRVDRSRAAHRFDRAVALLHHMTYPQAREAFEKVVALDPACVMAMPHRVGLLAFVGG